VYMEKLLLLSCMQSSDFKVSLLSLVGGEAWHGARVRCEAHDPSGL